MVRVKILGAGSIGNHLAQASRRMGWEVTICDVDREALRRTRESIYPSRYGRWDEAIGLCTVEEAPRGEFDMIFIGTPPDSHLSSALKALEENPRLIQIEKPLCPPSLERAQEFVEKLHQTETQVCVGFDHILGENTIQVERLLAEGVIGKAETLDVEFREHWGGIFTAHPWLDGPRDSYLGYSERGGGASSEHSHATNLWQHFAHLLGQGRIVEVSAVLDFVKEGNTNYDRLAALAVKTEKGFVGRIIQDVVTRPPRKWARLQGSQGYIEWHCGFEPGKDAVLCQREGSEKQTLLLPKSRPDDFYREMLHFDAILKGKLDGRASPISLERGLDTAFVIAAAHKSTKEERTVRVSYLQ